MEENVLEKKSLIRVLGHTLRIFMRSCKGIVSSSFCLGLKGA